MFTILDIQKEKIIKHLSSKEFVIIRKKIVDIWKISNLPTVKQYMWAIQNISTDFKVFVHKNALRNKNWDGSGGGGSKSKVSDDKAHTIFFLQVICW